MTRPIEALAAQTHRIPAIDIMRGLVIIIMAIDHVRDFFHASRIDPLDLSQTNYVLYYTRWITHFCAPVFTFLAGISAGLMRARKTPEELSIFLIKRGLWLIFLEATILAVGWHFPVSSYVIPLGTIWAIGAAMVITGLFARLPFWVTVMGALTLVFGHNILDYGLFPPNSGLGNEAPFWTILHNQGYSLWGDVTVLHLYPILPWTGVMLLGFILANLINQPPQLRQKYMLFLGGGAILLFLIVRGFNGYGNPLPWSLQEKEGFTALSFLNTQKYPPSLTYIMMTLGPALLLTAAFDRWPIRLWEPLRTLGRAPFFFYIAHIYLIHALVIAVAAVTGQNWQAYLGGFWTYTSGGYTLGAVYFIWAAVVIGLYPFCAWFAGVKARRKDWWLSYL